MVRTALLGLTAAVGLALPFAGSSAQAHPPAPVPYPSYPPPGYPYPGYPRPGYPAPGYPAHYPRPGYPTHRPPICQEWKVLYRSCHRDPWRCYGHYASARDAYRVARELRRDGYQVRVDD